MSSHRLYTPITLTGGLVTLSNRLALAPLTRGRSNANTRVPNELNLKYYTDRAACGLIISEGTHPSKQGRGWTQSPGLYSEAQVEGWKKITQSVHENHSVIFAQLWHMGRAAHSSFLEGDLPVGPSPIAIEGEVWKADGSKGPYEVPRELTTEEVGGVVEDFRKAAENAKKAGFDGVEIHAANGYILDEFLQSVTNKRTDKYGGSIENRFRLLKEILEAILTVFEPGRVGVRISPNGSYNSMGSEDFKEQYLYVAKELNAYKIGYLHYMNTAFGFHKLGEEFTLEDLRTVYDGVIVANGGFDKEKSEKFVEKDDKVVVSIGRLSLSNPDFALRFKNNWPLNDPLPNSLWFSHDAEGYSDQPLYEDKN